MLCAGILRQTGLRATGRICKLGSAHGPVNQESVNGTHSAMLAAHRCDSDVQLPYRFPIVPAIPLCNEASCLQQHAKAMIEAAQVAQDAQAGYACA